MQLDGTIVAPTSSGPWGKGILQWLEFTKLVGLTIRGSGTVDGNGAVWWQSTSSEDDDDGQLEAVVPFNSTAEQNSPIPVIISIDLVLPLFDALIYLRSNKLTQFPLFSGK